MRFQALFAIGIAVFSSGCASSSLQPVSITESERSEVLAADPIFVTRVDTPGFLFNTPAGAVAAADITTNWNNRPVTPSWSGIANIHGVPDFTDSVTTKFTEGLRTVYGPSRFEIVDDRLAQDTEAPVDYVIDYPSNYVLEIRTQFGSFHYLPLKWKTYAMNYSAQARLIRTNDQAIVWSARCHVKASQDPALKVPYDDFIGGDGEGLRNAASLTTQECANQLIDEFRSN